MPLYTASVQSLTRGWTYSTSEGDVPNPAVRTHLGDGLSYSWSFLDEQIPGPVEPAQATVRFVCRAFADVPALDRGDFLALTLRLSSAGAFILTPPPMRVTTVEVEVDDDLPAADSWPVTVTVKLVDELALLRSLFIQPGPTQSTVLPSSGVGPANYSRARWRERLAQIAYNVGRAIASPTWWAADERPPQTSPPPPSFVTGLDQKWVWTDTAFDIAEQLLNTWAPAYLTHTCVAGYSVVPSTFPAGYERVGPQGSNWGNFLAGSSPTFTEPQTQHRYYIVPASRRYLSTETATLPLHLEFRNGKVTTVGNAIARTGHNRLAIDAGVTSLPVRLRRSREHVVDSIKITGQDTYQQASGAAVQYRDANLILNNPGKEVLRTRVLNTHLDMGTGADSWVSTPRSSNAYPVIASAFWTDDSARAAWVYDDFQVSAAAMDAADRTTILPKLAPRAPGEVDGDGLVLRHLTIHRVDADARPADQVGLPSGFIASGRVEVNDGDIVYTLALTPGLPDNTAGAAAATPVTVADADTGLYQGALCSTIDPVVLVDDLALCDF
jgi:hypothetical protein